ncbi:acyl-CoA dehydrogenase, C-terminal domain protein [Mycobacterium xenopi 4042]|uniref:Acyl-CoA dehydrogenase, C-terminal domain protein n=1 Tax=Mycobacterium xenopi 4042 TaxID=1299334 RepID=X7ZVA8_MYCXE|nr:acyl-CoA dehydrogenase, C-terminal domain protein [Mycobacterium xenopi 4042]
MTDAGQVKITDGHNLAGEPRDRVDFDTPVHRFRLLDASVGAELLQRGAWARCVQVIGALDAAAESSVSHTRERVQFGRALSTFQSVQHALAAMAGEIERPVLPRRSPSRQQPITDSAPHRRSTRSRSPRWCSAAR